MAMPFRPALPMNRANLRCLGLSVGIAIALAGCHAEAPAPDKPRPQNNVATLFQDGWSHISKFCDGGRAVYVVSTQAAYGAGGIWVVEAAPECHGNAYVVGAQ